jgi:hypothetical protein
VSFQLSSPAEFYIKYLVIHPDGYTVEQIKKRLLRESLDFIGDEYLERVREEMPRVPVPFYPTDEHHMPSNMYICDQQIDRLFIPDRTMRTALMLLRLPRAKLQIETMIGSGQAHAITAAAVSRMCRVTCAADDIALFMHYFCNINLLDVLDMRRLHDLRDAIIERDIPEFKGRAASLKRTSYKDPRRIVSEMPWSPCTAFAAQVALGIMPPVAKIAERIDEVALLGVQRAHEAILDNGPAAFEKYAMFAGGSQRINEVSQSIAKPNDALKNLPISLRTDPVKAPTIQELTGGRHTVEMLPTKEVADGEDDGPDFDTDPSDTNGPE